MGSLLQAAQKTREKRNWRQGQKYTFCLHISLRLRSSGEVIKCESSKWVNNRISLENEKVIAQFLEIRLQQQ